MATAKKTKVRVGDTVLINHPTTNRALCRLGNRITTAETRTKVKLLIKC